MTATGKLVCRLLVLIGNSMALIGCLLLIAGVGGLIDMDLFAKGLSSGVRVIGSLAITGCLLSAIGYGYPDYVKK